MAFHKQAVTNFGILLLGVVLGATLPAVAKRGGSRDNDGDNKHQRHNEREREDRHPDNRSEDRRSDSRHAEPQRHGSPQRVVERRDHGNPHGNPEYRPAKHAARPVWHDDWQHGRARRWQEEHRSWHARGGYRGYRIPPERFRAHFGRAHWFRVHTVPVIVVEGRPRFQYGGFWFTMVDPWPETWAATWYRTDDVYVDYVDDGYYMYNRNHPGVAISVNVSF